MYIFQPSNLRLKKAYGTCKYRKNTIIIGIIMIITRKVHTTVYCNKHRVTIKLSLDKLVTLIRDKSEKTMANTGTTPSTKKYLQL